MARPVTWKPRNELERSYFAYGPAMHDGFFVSFFRVFIEPLLTLLGALACSESCGSGQTESRPLQDP
jgi:hypothetical protein